MNALIDAAISRSRTVIATLLLLLISGAAAYVNIPKESDPDVNIPIIYVSTTLDGISPEDAERLLVRPMEEELRSIEGVKEMSATSFEGGGNVILEFDAGFDVDTALQDVREAVDRVKPDLPAETDEPTVNEVNLSLFPVLVITLSGDVPERTLIRLARDLRDEIEGVPSVLEVVMAGDREEMVEIIVDPLLVESYGLNGDEIAQVVNRSNRLVAAGTLDTGSGRFAIKVPGLFEGLEDILSLPVKVEGDAVVEFRDIATIRRTFKDPEGFARVDGLPAVALEVSKRTGENIIDTIGAVRSVVEAERAFWPGSVQVTYSQDRSEDIRTMLTDLQNNVISAILLVMIVVVGALGVRSAGLVGVAIPGSFLTGILVLSLLGLTVNIVVLFSLILAVGMLVDGAIVVTEYADRKMTEGQHRKHAYALAAKRMAWPIIASTATTLAAFMPLLFWPGVVGEFMKYLPITLLATLAASLLMALVFVPTLGAYIGKPADQVVTDHEHSLAGEDHADLQKLGGFTGGYLKVLRFALRHPAKVLAGAAAALIGTWMIFVFNGKGVEFFPEVEPEQVLVMVHARGNLSVDERDGLMREVEVEVLKLADEFSSVYTRTGAAGDGQDVAEDVIGQITVELNDWDKRRPADEILTEIRTLTAGLAGIQVETREPENGPPVGKPVQVQFSSRFPELLPDAIVKTRNFMETMDGLVDIEDSRPIPAIEWEIAVNRSQAAKYGVDVTAVGDSIKLVTTGLTIGSYRPDDSDDEIDIIVRYPERWRSLNQLDDVRVSSGLASIPISNFVTRTAQPKVGTLNRVDARRVMTVKADLAEGVLADSMVSALRAWLPTAGIDPRVEWEFRGEDEEQKAAQAFLGKAFGVALFIMAIILVTQFNSFYSALLILSAVVMSTSGVLIGLLATAQPFGIVMTGIGVIALAGIVVNNNIVLIDTFDRLRETTDDAMDAIMRTGAQRLRPVLLTTVTTILGLTPMVARTNIDFITREVSFGAPSTQWWVSLSTAIVFGLSFATVLTLVVTPSALMVRANVHAWRQHRRERRAESAASRAPAAARRPRRKSATVGGRLADAAE
ncbi:MAG: efflux RND transporter permease subunit [Inquilinus sp.]|nr:efflux RND transporter permease subunit [Inquilinus sp.]